MPASLRRACCSVRLLGALLLVSCSAVAQSRLHVASNIALDSAVDKILVGKGVRIGNVKLTGARTSFGAFRSDTAMLGMARGLVLSTGNVQAIAHANNSPGTSGLAADLHQPFRPDKDLARVCRCRLYDQIILEFDFVPAHNKVAFRYCFASEEYNEYVGSAFNDAFLFLLTGPKGKRQNLALLPDGKTRVAVNTVNLRSHPNLYISNDYFLNYGLLKHISQRPRVPVFRWLWNAVFNHQYNSPLGFYTLLGEKKKLNQTLVNNVEFDGLTRVLTARAYVQPWQLYHLKLVLGDVGDAIFDSGVFLEEGSLQSELDPTEPGFVAYRDQSQGLNWDSIFGRLKPAVSVPIAPHTRPAATVLFGVDEATLAPAEQAKLAAFAQQVLAQAGALAVQGFTDSTGTYRHNQQLAQQRARAVLYFLLSQGVPRSRLRYVDTSATPAGASSANDYPSHRRVEIRLLAE